MSAPIQGTLSQASLIFVQPSGVQPTPPPPTSFWTVFTPSVDTRTIYVSSSDGDDSNDGLSTDTPKATIQAGLALLRDGFPDWLLFKAGDSWDISAGGGWGNWADLGITGGRSTSERILISSYGTGVRPLFLTGDTDGLFFGGGGPDYIEHVAFVSLDFYAQKRDPGNGAYDPLANDDLTGMKLRVGTHDLLFEDMRWRFFQNGLDSHNSGSNTFDQGGVAFRRCQITDNYSTTGAHAQGIYVDAPSSDGFTFEECLFDYNGYRDDSTPPVVKDIFSHDVYLDGDVNHPNPKYTAINNILTRASSHGMQMRSGVNVTQNGNYVEDCAIGLLFGYTGYPDLTGTCEENTILHPHYIGVTPKQYGIWIDQSGGSTCKNNLVANAFDAAAGTPIFTGVPNVTYSGNVVYNWPVGSSMGSYPDPTRDLAAYDAHLGGPGTFDHAIAQLRAQSKAAWDDNWSTPAIQAWVRAGWGL